jgi:hypothetical protein
MADELGHADAPADQVTPPWKQPSEEVAAELDADVLLFNGGIDRWWDRAMIDGCRSRRRRANVLLLLVTGGGDADAGYRMARCLQRYYSRVIVFVSGYCKSAGTLIAFGAHELVVADHGELGPLDVQMRKSDELWETSSGLTVMEALSTLEETAYKMLEDGFLRIKAGSAGQITFKTASEIAVGIVNGAMEPIYKQIDPMHVGEAGRAMKIARDYGERLNAVSGNLKPGSLVELVNGYSSHGFVLDREEAARHFQNVREPSQTEDTLADMLGEAARVPLVGEQPTWGFLNDELPSAPEGGQDEPAAATVEVDGRTNGRTAPEVAGVAGDAAREQVVDQPLE